MTVTGMLRRPTTDREDLALSFVGEGSGAYVAESALGKGVWDVEITATGAGGETYRKTFRLFVKD
jgi:nitrogen fixation protein FixH